MWVLRFSVYCRGRYYYSGGGLRRGARASQCVICTWRYRDLSGVRRFAVCRRNSWGAIRNRPPPYFRARDAGYWAPRYGHVSASTAPTIRRGNGRFRIILYGDSGGAHPGYSGRLGPGAWAPPGIAELSRKAVDARAAYHRPDVADVI